jgi:hypothetical protein
MSRAIASDHHHGGQLAAGQHKIANGDFVRDQVLANALVDAFITAAQQQQPGVLRQLLGDGVG